MTPSLGSFSSCRHGSVIDIDSLAGADAASRFGFGLFCQTFDWIRLAKVQREVQVDLLLVSWKQREQEVNFTVCDC